MKVWAFVLFAAALANAAPTSLDSRTIEDDLQDFVNLIPNERIAEIVAIYVSCDREVGAIAEYVQSDSFKEFLSALKELPEVIELHNYLENSRPAGVSSVENSLREVSDLPADDSQRVDGEVPANCEQPITGGLRGLVKDIFSVLPLDQIKALFVEKMKTSPEFRAFIARLSSPEIKDIVQRLKANPQFQQLILQAKGDIEALINQVQTFIGVHYY